MSQKSAIMLGMIIGSIAGGYVPVILGDSILSYWGLIASAVGGLIGIFLAYKLTQ